VEDVDDPDGEADDGDEAERDEEASASAFLPPCRLELILPRRRIRVVRVADSICLSCVSP
jgi:hypothetical protein